MFQNFKSLFSSCICVQAALSFTWTSFVPTNEPCHEELYENKGAAICFRYNIVSTTHMLPKIKFSSMYPYSLSDLAVTHKDRLCRDTAQI